MRRILVIKILILIASSILTFIGCKDGNGGTAGNQPELKLEMVRALEGPGSGHISDIAVDVDGNIYIVGNFSGTIDMDSGTGMSNEIAAGGDDSVFLAKYDTLGNYEWSVSWEAGERKRVDSIKIGPNGRIYVLGTYTGSVDFDPGPGTVVSNETGNSGKYVSRFNTLGGFEWVRMWEGGAPWEGLDRIVYPPFYLNEFSIDPNGRLIFAGEFAREADFDPGPGVFEMDTNDGGRAFLLALTGDGEFEWAVKLADAYNCNAPSVTTDSESNIYVTGYFERHAGAALSGSQAHFNETTWAYISKFNSAGESEWWRCWGGRNSGCRPNFIGAAPDGRVYVAGWCGGNIDLNPGPGIYRPVGNLHVNLFISGFDSTGDFTGALMFSQGSMMPWDYYSGSYDFGSDASMYLFGHVSRRIDLDPGPGEMFVEPLPTESDEDTASLYLINRYGPDGRLMMANYVSDTAGEHPACFTVDDSGNVYMGGSFHGTVDFDPGPAKLVLESTDEEYNGYFLKFAQVP